MISHSLRSLAEGSWPIVCKQLRAQHLQSIHSSKSLLPPRTYGSARPASSIERSRASRTGAIDPIWAMHEEIDPESVDKALGQGSKWSQMRNFLFGTTTQKLGGRIQWRLSRLDD